MHNEQRVWLIAGGLAVISLLSLHTGLILSGEPIAQRLNKVIELLSAGKPALGIFSQGRSLLNAAALADSDFDFVMIDMEHAPLDFERLHAFLLGMVSRREVFEKRNLQPNVIPFVRVPHNGREQLQFVIKQVLDLGVYGVMVPHVNTAEEALAAVVAARFAQRRGAPDFKPEGQRGFSPGIAARYWGLTVDEYTRRADLWPLDPQGELLLIVQIEEAQAVRHVEEIINVPGVGAVFIGPADLSVSMGVKMDAPEVEDAIQKILHACLRRGIPCGIPATAGNVAMRIRQGFRFITLGGDLGIPENAARALRAARGSD